MRRLKPALCALFALCLLCLPACGQTPEQSLAAAQKKLSEAGSLSCVIKMDMDMSCAGESFNITSVCQADCTSEPAAVRLQVSAEMGRLGSLAYTAWAVSSGGAYSAYINLSDAWVRQDLSGVEELERYDIRLASARWISGLSAASEAGVSEVGGQTARRYDCTVSAKAVDGIMAASGAYEALSVLDLSDAAARDMLSGLGELPMSVWVGEQGLPLRYELDLAGVAGALMDAVAESLGEDYPAMSVGRLTVSIILSDFDAVEPIEVPSEAIGARPLEGEEIF